MRNFSGLLLAAGLVGLAIMGSKGKNHSASNDSPPLAPEAAASATSASTAVSSPLAASTAPSPLLIQGDCLFYEGVKLKDLSQSKLSPDQRKEALAAIQALVGDPKSFKIKQGQLDDCAVCVDLENTMKSTKALQILVNNIDYDPTSKTCSLTLYKKDDKGNIQAITQSEGSPDGPYAGKYAESTSPNLTKLVEKTVGNYLGGYQKGCAMSNLQVMLNPNNTATGESTSSNNGSMARSISEQNLINGQAVGVVVQEKTESPEALASRLQGVVASGQGVSLCYDNTTTASPKQAILKQAGLKPDHAYRLLGFLNGQALISDPTQKDDRKAISLHTLAAMGDIRYSDANNKPMARQA